MCGTEKNHSTPLLSKLHDLPRRVCYDSVIVSCVRVRNGKKPFKSLAQQTTRFAAPRSMLRGVRYPNTCSLSEHVFVVRTQKSFAKVFVVRFVHCPNCSLTGHPLYLVYHQHQRGGGDCSSSSDNNRNNNNIFAVPCLPSSRVCCTFVQQILSS